MKKPYIYALGAFFYINIIVFCLNNASKVMPNKNTLIPVVMLSLLVLSVAVMGFLFLSEPLSLYLENKKREALVFFGQTVGVFACFIIAFIILLFFLR